MPLAEAARTHPHELIAGTLAVIACFALFYLATAFALGHGTTVQGFDRAAFLLVQLVAILFMAAGIVAAGYWSDRTNPRRVLMWGCVATVPTGLLMAPLMGSGSLALVGVYLSLALFVMGLVYGPLGAFLPSLFPARVRYTGVSMAFNVGGILGGALTPVVAQLLASSGGLAPVGLYLAGAGAISLIGLFVARPSALD